MEELRLGKISNEELAEWFLITPKNLSSHKGRYLKKLEEYCAFTPYRGGVEVTEIYKYTYSKNKNL